MDAADWDARYSGADLVWSAGPNVWVRELCTPMPPGRALDVAAGEGRNALWLVEQGWSVVAADFSPVGVERMRQIADRRLGDGVRPSLPWSPTRTPLRVRHASCRTAAGTAYRPGADLVPAPAAHRVGRGACRGGRGDAVGGVVLVVAHAVRNLTEGVGGPQDATILLDPEDVVASAAELPVDVELAQLRARDVEGADRPALDTVVLLRRSRLTPRSPLSRGSSAGVRDRIPASSAVPRPRSRTSARAERAGVPPLPSEPPTAHAATTGPDGCRQVATRWAGCAPRPSTDAEELGVCRAAAAARVARRPGRLGQHVDSVLARRPVERPLPGHERAPSTALSKRRSAPARGLSAPPGGAGSSERGRDRAVAQVATDVSGSGRRARCRATASSPSPRGPRRPPRGRAARRARAGPPRSSRRLATSSSSAG